MLLPSHVAALDSGLLALRSKSSGSDVAHVRPSHLPERFCGRQPEGTYEGSPGDARWPGRPKTADGAGNPTEEVLMNNFPSSHVLIPAALALDKKNGG